MDPAADGGAWQLPRHCLPPAPVLAQRQRCRPRGDDRSRYRLQGGQHRHRLPAAGRRGIRQFTGRARPSLQQVQNMTKPLPDVHYAS